MVRFGIVGFGLHAVKRLMPGFSVSKRCQVTALSRRNLAAAKQSAAQHKIPLAFDSARDLCASSEVDAILVTTPNACHLADVLTAVAAGKPVLVRNRWLSVRKNVNRWSKPHEPAACCSVSRRSFV